MRKKYLFLLLTAVLLPMNQSLANLTKEMKPLQFIGPKVALINMNKESKKFEASGFTIPPETISQIIQVLREATVLSRKLEMPNENILRAIKLSWNVNDSGVYDSDTKEIIVRETWGQEVVETCKDSNEELVVTDRHRLGIVVHEFGHAIFLQNIKKAKINSKKHREIINGYNEMFGDALSVLVMNDLEIKKGCQDIRTFVRNNEVDLLSDKIHFRVYPVTEEHIVFDPARLVFGDLIKKNLLSPQLLIKALLDSMVKSIKFEIGSAKSLTYIQRNKLFIKILQEDFEFLVSTQDN